MKKFSIFNFQFSISKGFTVLETIIAIFVVSLAISGATLAARGGIIGGSTAKEETKAFYLAQEAVEILSNKRTANDLLAFSGDPDVTWLSGIAEDNDDPCSPGKTCRMDAKTQTITNCHDDVDNICPYLKQDPSTFLYGYDSGNATNFKREVQIQKSVSNPDEIAVNVTISWQHGSMSKNLTTKTLMTNWFRSE